MMDNFRRITFPSGITLVILAWDCDRGGGVAAASEIDELECVRSGVREACERLNGERILYATGGCGDDVGES